MKTRQTLSVTSLSFVIIAVVVIVNVEALGGGRINAPDIISDALSDKAWQKCSQEYEVCYVDEDCCAGHECRPSFHFLRPKLMCVGVRSRPYRHLDDNPAIGKEVKDLFVKPTFEKPTEKKTIGDGCTSSNQCEKDLCCQVVYLFRIGRFQVCEPKLSLSKCVD